MNQKNDIFHDLAGIDVVILCGGKGTRLSAVVPEKPKALAPIGNRPFLDHLIKSIRSAGAERIILCVGHLAEQIKERYTDTDIFLSTEEVPLGTGGAIKSAEPLVLSESFVVMNGDSWVEGGIPWSDFKDFHAEKGALVTLLLVPPRAEGEKDYGAVFLNDEKRVVAFNEKQNYEKQHFMSAGVYYMDKETLAKMPNGAFSIETDFFPGLIGTKFYGFPVDREAIDIGTPERYLRANEMIKRDDKIFFK